MLGPSWCVRAARVPQGGVVTLRAPRVVVAGISSGCGKTTIATGLMGALAAKGLRVQGFKVGPDFIDPSYHSAVTGRKSRNLDPWMLTTKTIQRLFEQNSSDCGVSIVEGVMGLFDEGEGMRGRGTTAHVAKLLRSPVLLVVDAWGLGASAGAIVAGCKAFDRDLNVAGVVLNRVSGERHAKMCGDSIERVTKVPVVGEVPFDPDFELPERHLGLVPAEERPELRTRLRRIVEVAGRSLDLGRISDIAKNAPPLPEPRAERTHERKTVRLAVAYDEAFNFYYQDGLDRLSAAGAELCFFSPTHDAVLPADIDGIYIGGGFPEVLAKDLASNRVMRRAVKKAAEGEMPIVAECGGLMYLTSAIWDFDGRKHAMVGLLDCETRMVKRLTLSYTSAEVLRANILAEPGVSVRGHEFHRSELSGVPTDARFAYRMKRGTGIQESSDGLLEHSALAQYMHLNFAAVPKLASSFVRACERYSRT